MAIVYGIPASQLARTEPESRKDEPMRRPGTMACSGARRERSTSGAVTERAELQATQLVLLLCLLALSGLTAALFASSARATVSFSWSAPELVDHQYPFFGAATLTGVSCSSASFCAAVDSYGNVVTTSDPTGGSSAWSTQSVKPETEGINGFTGISCPSSGLCLATDDDGGLWASADPTGGAASWSVVYAYNLPGGPPEGFPAGLSASCPSTSLCVAVAGNDVATSTDPTGGQAAWTLTTGVDTGSSLTDVSCPSTSFCVATDYSGNILTSSDPAGGAGAWQATNIDGSTPIMRLSCASESLCVAVDNEGNVLTSADPGGGASAWHKLEHLAAGYGEGLDVNCSASGLCLLTAGGNGTIFVSTDPTGGASAWHEAQIRGVTTGGVSCPTAGLCVVADLTNPEGTAVSTGQQGNGVAVSTDPTGGTAAWTATSLNTDGDNDSSAITCASTELCIITDYSGNILTSTNPSSGPTSWKAGYLTGNEIEIITAAACPSTSLCVAVNLYGNVLTSTNPAGGAASWQVTSGEYKSVGNLRGLSCPTATFCAAAGEGDVLISTDPTGGLSAWHANHIETSSVGPTYEGLNDIACPAASLCVAVDRKGDVLTSTEPAGNASWQSAHVDSATDDLGEQAELTDVTCASVSFCVALDNAGNILTSTNPAGGGTAWHVATHVNEGSYGRITCPSEGLCVTTGYNNGGGEACMAATPISESGHAWTLVTNCGQPGAIACPSAAFCVALEGSDVQTATASEGSSGGRSEPPPNKGGSTPPPSNGQPPTETPVIQPSDTAPSGSEHTPAVAASQLRAWLAKLVPAGKTAMIPAIVKHDGYSLSFNALEAGTLSVQWFVMPHAAHAAKKTKPKAVLVASGHISIAGAGRSTVFLKLTPLGKRLLRHAKRLKIEAKERFVPRVGSGVTAIKGAVIGGKR